MGIQDRSGVSRSLLFALTGMLWFGSWVAPPSFELSPSMTKWLVVLWFSASLLSLAAALLVFGRMVSSRQGARLARVASASAGLCGVANIFEDGVQIEGFFYVFVLGLLILDVALLALTIVIARAAPDGYRRLAVIPAGALAGILLFPVAGGPIALITWLAAAAAAQKMASGRTQVPSAPTTP
jgi:hypothetical protein